METYIKPKTEKDIIFSYIKMYHKNIDTTLMEDYSIDYIMRWVHPSDVVIVEELLAKHREKQEQKK